MNFQRYKLGEICKVDWGNTSLTKKSYIDDGKYLAVSATGCDGRIGHAEYKAGTPVLSAIGAQCGKMFYPTEDFTAIKNTITLTPIEGLCDGEFLFHLFNFIELPKRGAAQPFISKGDIQKFEVDIPPISKQLEIVENLSNTFSEIDNAIQLVQQNIKNASSLLENFIANQIDKAAEKFPTIRLGNACNGVEYGTSSKSLNEGLVPVIRMGNLSNGAIDFTDLVYTSDADDIKKYALKAGDVLFNRTNSPVHVGKTAVFNGGLDAIFAGYLIRVNYKKELVNPEYLNLYLNSEKVRNYGFSVMSHSINQANINGSKLKEYPFVMPSIEIQNEISFEVARLREEVVKLKNSYENKLNNLMGLKAAILTKAFTSALPKV